MIIAIPAINLISYLNQLIQLPDFMSSIENWLMQTEEDAADLTEKLVNVTTIGGLMYNMLLIAIVPALGEELFFRGSVMQIINRLKRPVFAIWVTAFIFSAVHFQFYGFIPRFLLGALFGYLLYWSNSMWLPILAHFLNNGLAVVFYYLKYNNYETPDIDTVGTGDTVWLGVLSVVLTIGGIIIFSKNLKSQSMV